MIDQRVNAIIAEATYSLGADLIIEIGAGTGSLTKHLLNMGQQVHAIERDRDLIPILREQFAHELACNNLVMHEADGARFSLSDILSPERKGVLVGNLPYHLTSSIIILALKNFKLLKGAVFLVQKEVADRLVSLPNNKEYGFLTAVLGLAFSIDLVSLVSKNAFWPIPKIDSAIIKMTVCDRGISGLSDIEAFLVFVRSIFQKRRKKLSTILNSQIAKAEWAQIGINPDLRPENLNPAQFLLIYEYVEAQCLKDQK